METKIPRSTSQSLKLFLIAVFFLVVTAMGLGYWKLKPQPAEELSVERSNKFVSKNPITPIPQETGVDVAKAALGEKLFNDPQLSHNNKVSCASCHNLKAGGTDQLPRSVGINGREGNFNAPTVFNASYNFRQFWDGRAETLEEQIDGPTHAANEMGSNWAEIIGKLRQSPEYVAEFARLYPQGIQAQTIRDAIAIFERSLTTPNSRFDQYLQDNQSALSPAEKEGYQIFKSYGCISCHQGVNMGGNMYQKFGVMGDYFKDRGTITEADYGRYNVTQNEADKFIFKVPSLRNIALTAPYFHDGSTAKLENAVAVMGRYQLGRELTPSEIDALVKFLQTLTGEYKKPRL